MFSDDPWILDLEDSLDEIFDCDKDRIAAKKLFASIGFNVEYANSTEQDNLEEYLYLHGDTNLNYVVLERECMKHASFFCDLFRIESSLGDYDSVSVIYIEIESCFLDRDYYACALIKLVTKALSCKAWFLFKHSDEICFGAGDNLTEHGEFVISKWVDRDNGVSLVEEVFDFKIDEVNLRKAHMSFFEAVLGCSHLTKQKSSKNMSRSIEKFRYHGESIIGYNEKFTNSEEEYQFRTKRKKLSLLYQLTSDLAYIDHDDIDSYELLERAMKAEEESSKIAKQHSNSESLTNDEINNLKSINDEVFDDAENLLRFIKEKEKEKK
jgi:hypothetical protein